MRYNLLCDFYTKLENTSKRLDKTYYISQLLKATPKNEIQYLVLLIQGRIYPQWDEREIGVASKLIVKALNASYGVSVDNIERLWKETGDLGIVAEKLSDKKNQSTLFSNDIDAKDVFNTLRKLTELQGEGTVNKKIGLISHLLTSATPIEARYIVRTILGELRIGAGSGSMRDAIVWNFFPPVYGIFFYCTNCGSWMPNTPKCLECKKELHTKFSEVDFKNSLRIKKNEEIKDFDLTKYDVIIPEDSELARKIYNYLSESVQRAYDFANDFSVVAQKAIQSLAGLSEIGIEPGKPIKVMLAQKVMDIKQGLERVGIPAEAEYKYDGFRMQVHKIKDKVALFTRRLDNVTEQFPEVALYVKSHIKAENVILDSEAVGFDPKTGKYTPFQSISQRIKRKYDIEELAKKLPVELNVFDILFYEGKDLLDEKFSKRREIIERIIKQEKRKIVLAENIISSSEEEVHDFYSKSLSAGNEGIMLKSLEAPYKPGSRVGFMVKLKPTMDSLDLVIVGAEWGEGKRANWLTSFTIACINEDGEFLELGKVGTGIKEIEGEELSFQHLTDALKKNIISEKGKEVKLKPTVVLEVSFEEIQKSPTYSSGYALRFPRVTKLREERNTEDISTLESVEEAYFSQK